MPVFTLSVIGDVARAVALPVTNTRRQVYVPGMQDLEDLRALLHSTRARRNPPYVLAVLTAYVRRRDMSRKRIKAEVESELRTLEREFPEFAAEFRFVHKKCGIKRDPALDESPGQQQRVSSCACARHSRLDLRTLQHTHGRDDLVAPPPPYASDDPDPVATRLLIQQIAAEAGASSALFDAARDAEEAHGLAAPPPLPPRMRRESRVWEPRSWMALAART